MTLPLDARDRESIRRDLESGDEEVRRLAIERARALPRDEAMPMLAASLGDDSWRVRKAAVDGLVTAPAAWPVAEHLVRALADGDNPGRRNAAVEALVRSGRGMVGPLLETSANADVDVRKLVVDALAGIGAEEAAPRLVEMLDDVDPNVRGAVADALGAIGGDAAVRGLVERALRDDEDPLVRFSALRALARLEVPLAADELSGALAHPMLRPAAFGVLGRSDDPVGVEALLEGLLASSRSTREAAMEALVRVAARSEPAAGDGLVARVRETAAGCEELLDFALERLEEAELQVRLMLVQFLGLIPSPRSVVPLLRAARDEALAEVAIGTLVDFAAVAEEAIDASWAGLDGPQRAIACETLGHTRGAAGAERLLAALDENDLATRASAAEALGRRQETHALCPLVRCLRRAADDPDPESDVECAAAIEALAAIAGRGRCSPWVAREAAGALSDALEGASEAARLAIARVLGEVGSAEQVPIVALLISDPSPGVRAHAVRAAARLSSGALPEPLRLALADESSEVRSAVAQALGRIGGREAAEGLERLAADDDAAVRAAAMRALGELGATVGPGEVAERVLPVLERGLDDVGPVALAVVDAFDALGGSQSLLPLRRLLGGEAPELVQAVVRCIAAHGDADDLAELFPLASHPHWTVRADAIQALADRGVCNAVPAVLRRLEREQDEFVRDTILRALARLEA